jgi:hypothetical protein
MRSGSLRVFFNQNIHIYDPIDCDAGVFRNVQEIRIELRDKRETLAGDCRILVVRTEIHTDDRYHNEGFKDMTYKRMAKITAYTTFRNYN